MQELFNGTVRDEKICHCSANPGVLFLHATERLCDQSTRRLRTDVKALVAVEILFTEIVDAT